MYATFLNRPTSQVYLLLLLILLVILYPHTHTHIYMFCSFIYFCKEDYIELKHVIGYQTALNTTALLHSDNIIIV